MRRLLTAVAIGAALAAAAVPAHAAAPKPLTIVYPLRATTHLQTADADLKIGRATLTGTANLQTGKLTADLPLPTSPLSFRAFGFLPASADVVFTQVRPITATLDLSGAGSLSATALYVITLRNVVVGGSPANVGDSCQTVRPVTLTAAGPFGVTTGGTLTGTYGVGAFKDCGRATDLVNLLAPGDGNTLTLDVGQGTVQSS